VNLKKTIKGIYINVDIQFGAHVFNLLRVIKYEVSNVIKKNRIQSYIRKTIKARNKNVLARFQFIASSKMKFKALSK
jgi:hypothetical protein